MTKAGPAWAARRPATRPNEGVPAAAPRPEGAERSLPGCGNVPLSGNLNDRKRGSTRPFDLNVAANLSVRFRAARMSPLGRPSARTVIPGVWVVAMSSS